MRSLAALPFYPTVLTVVFLGNLAVTFVVAPQSVVRSMVIGIAVAAVLTMVMCWVVKDRHRGGVVAFSIILVAVSAITPVLTVAVGVAVLVAIAAFEHSHGPVPWNRVTVASNALSLILFAILMLKGITAGAPEQMARDLGIGLGGHVQAGLADATYPDVYVVLLDGHPRGDVLEDVIGYDPTAFLDGLRSRGFIVAPRSRSSYGYTAGTLTSMFQMRHLDEIPELKARLRGDAQGREIMRNLIGAGAALDQFRRRGYEIITAPSEFEDVTLRTADRVLESGAVNEYEMTVIRSLGLPAVIDLWFPTVLTGSVAQRVSDNLDAIPRLAREPRSADSRPRLMFIHVPSPHAPIIFNADGTTPGAHGDHLFNFEAPAGLEDLRRRYAANIAVLDERVLSTLSALDSVPAIRPRAVIVFSDHGIDAFAATADDEHRQHTANLFASRMPGGRDLYGRSPVTVNLFPILLDGLFDADIPLQDARIRDSGADDPWDWVELAAEQ